MRAFGGRPTVRCRSEPPLSSIAGEVRRGRPWSGDFRAEHAVGDVGRPQSVRRSCPPRAGKDHVVHEAHALAHPGFHGVAQAGGFAFADEVGMAVLLTRSRRRARGRRRGGQQALADDPAQALGDAGADLRLLGGREDVEQRLSVVAASLVCMVPITRWPVSLALMAISIVSRSRSSPITITSGSSRRAPLSAVLKRLVCGRPRAGRRCSPWRAARPRWDPRR
jgi:hypothetical protein